MGRIDWEHRNAFTQAYFALAQIRIRNLQWAAWAARGQLDRIATRMLTEWCGEPIAFARLMAASADGWMLARAMVNQAAIEVAGRHEHFPPEYVPKTELGRRLLAARWRYRHAGNKFLTLEELDTLHR